jgi:hypothetical protein
MSGPLSPDIRSSLGTKYSLCVVEKTSMISAVENLPARITESLPYAAALIQR